MTVEMATANEVGVDLIVRCPDGMLVDLDHNLGTLLRAGVPENDGKTARNTIKHLGRRLQSYCVV